MKKHLTLPPPSFRSVGVEVSPRVEAVVFHALEKEVEARTPTVEEFLTELRAAVEADGVTMQAGRETIGGDFGATLFEASPIDTAPPQKLPDVPAGSTAGKISPPVLSPAEQERLAASRARHEFEQQERDRIAREELEREAAARRQAAQEAERKRKEEDERVNREKAEREKRELQQREQIERVERQARELEERLAKLSTSMPPSASTVDPESTQMHQGLRTAQISRPNIPGVTPPISDSATGMSIPIPAPQPKSQLPKVVGGVLLVLLLLGGGTAAFFMLKPSIGSNGNKPTPSPTIEAKTIKSDMVEILGGKFQMGRDNGLAQEAPAHQETVPSFFMDRTEVTCTEYADFVRDAHYAPPKYWNGTEPPYGTEQWPVLSVSAEDAEAFAEWRSKRDNLPYRLPTEQEWEYAARNGERSNLFPWGNDSWKPDKAWLKEASPRDVNSFAAGNNIWGVADLIGNVWEWTSTKMSVYPGNPTVIPTAMKDFRMFRGGGYDLDPSNKNTPVTSCIRSFAAPTSKIPTVGFRLVRSAQ
jgi:formylglycine-generating enzyme required for sulfatase activity